MTVPIASNKVLYSGNGSTTVFAFAFPITAEADLRVILRDSTGDETVQVLTTDYTVSASPWSSGGSITMIVAPASGETLLVKREVAATQLVDYRDGDAFPAETHESALDKLTYLVQQVLETNTRAVTLQEVTALTGLTLPDPSAGTVLYSADGLTLLWGALATLTGSPIVTPVAISDGGTGGITAAAARTNLGENASGSPFTRKHNFAAAVAPATTDDTSADYAVGSFWYDTTADIFYTCIDSTASAAVWVLMRNDARPGFKNRVINGDVVIDQRNVGAAVTVNSTSSFFGADMWRGAGEAADGVFTMTRSTATPPSGFTHFMRAAVTTADASIGASQTYRMVVPFEGLNMADLGFGAAGAQSVTVSFWVRSSLTGVFSGALKNNGSTRSYPFSFTINSANTWEKKTITIAGDTSGTWSTDNTLWGVLIFDLGSGTTLRGTAGAWVGSSINGVTGAVSLIATNSATLDITGLQLEAGTVATEFERLSFATRLERCQRYYQKTFPMATAPAQNAGVAGTIRGVAAIAGTASRYMTTGWTFATRMCAAPTVVTYNPSAANAQVRDTSLAVDCSATSVNGEERAVYVITSGNAATVAASTLALHLTASAEL